MLRISQSRLAVAGRPRPSFKLELFGPTLDPAVTFTRALNTATYFNSAGLLTTANANVPRFDYDPSTLAPRGLLIEEARTNSIRNNTMQGAVAGTPGTAPNNWSMQTTATGLTRTIVGTGTESGITYLDVRYAGTTTGAISSAILANSEQTTQIAAANGQSWTGSWYLSLSAGSLAGLSLLNIQITERDAAGALLASSTSNVLPTISSSNLATQRFVVSRTFNNALTAFVTCEVRFSVPISTAVDFTLRIGLPQLEQGAFATSVIPTTTTALTRNADVASVNTLSPWYNATEGTLYGEVSSAAQTVGGVSRRIANINDGTEADRITVGWAGATSVAAAFVTDNSVAQAGFTSPSGAYPFPTKVALAYKAADFQAAVNGSAFATVSSGTVPTVNRMTIGDVVTGSNGTQNINGHIRRITYYPRRLSNAELQAITS